MANYTYTKVVRVKCPYCGFENKIYSGNDGEIDSMYCDVEEGGCDKLFGFQVNLVPKVRVWHMEEVK